MVKQAITVHGTVFPFSSVSFVIIFVLFSISTPLLARKSAAEKPVATQKGPESNIQPTSAETAAHDLIGRRLPLWSCIPFVGILLSIAIVPMIAPVFWHHHFVRIALGWGLAFAIPFLIIYGGDALYYLLHAILIDYLPFLILLWGLFTISGGIYIEGSFVGKPLVNTCLIAVGTLLASVMGTTGAAMLLIRPLLRTNKNRQHKVHTVVFFIFLVANIGGSLTPVGDPPLFLGFLHGVPFFWTLKLFPEMLLVSLLLLFTYFIIDSILYRREGEFNYDEDETRTCFKIHGGFNIVLLIGVVASVVFSGVWHIGDVAMSGVRITYESLFRDLLILSLGIVSITTTRAAYREANGFTWYPIREVAYLFAGIFLTIIAPLLILKAGSGGAAASLAEIVNSPGRYFWISGVLSSILDNAPTYLAFFNLASGNLGIAADQVNGILRGIIDHPNAVGFVADLTAISIGSVFFGAMTYIGNAPNFMVRSIAEEANVRMPSFFGYCLWSGIILLPTFIIVTLIFF